LAAIWSGRVCRVQLAGDPSTNPELPPADLIGSVAADQLVVNGVSLPLPLEGLHNARNLMLAVSVAQELGLNTAQLLSMQVAMSGGRNRRLQQGGFTVLDETYNASPEAMLAALDLLASQPGRHFAVLGTMLELGDSSLELHRQVASRAAELRLDGLVVVDAGEEGRVMQQAASGLTRLAWVGTPEEAASTLADWLAAGDVLLLKASRGVALERLLPQLPLL
jgi:UDP-N-acetylmuramoyl-tripeptide--D-alanyl-D-alanine ligase